MELKSGTGISKLEPKRKPLKYSKGRGKKGAYPVGKSFNQFLTHPFMNSPSAGLLRARLFRLIAMIVIDCIVHDLS